MGQYFDWKSHYQNNLSTDSLLKKLKALNFIHSVTMEIAQVLENIDQPRRVTEMTEDEWTGYFDGNVGHYKILFKSDTDAMAFKLTFL